MPLCNSLFSSVGWIKWLSSSESVGCKFWDKVTKRLKIPLGHMREASAVLWAALWRGPSDKELREYHWPIASRALSPQSNSLQGTESCRHPRTWAWKRIIPWASLQLWPLPWLKAWDCDLLRDWAEGIQPSHTSILQPHKIRDNKCLLFLAAKYWGHLSHNNR